MDVSDTDQALATFGAAGLRWLAGDRAVHELGTEFADTHGLVCHVVPEAGAPELRLGLRFAAPDRLSVVVARLLFQPGLGCIRIHAQLDKADAGQWGKAVSVRAGRMRSRMQLGWPDEKLAVAPLLAAALHAARQNAS